MSPRDVSSDRPRRPGSGPTRAAPVLTMGALTLMVTAALACQKEASPEWREAAERAAAARSAEEADRHFDPAAFDTVDFSSEYARAERGRVVYEHSCARCHGTDGRDIGPYAREKGMEVDSMSALLRPYRGDIASIRRAIFVGHAHGMPAWGLTELSPADVDAVAFFIEERLTREDPEAEGGSGEG